MNTPRTDAAERKAHGISDDFELLPNLYVPGDFARQLETELAAMAALANRLAESLGNLKTEVANTFWTSRNGAEMIPGTAESIREEVNEAIGNAFANSLEALAAYEKHKTITPNLLM